MEEISIDKLIWPKWKSNGYHHYFYCGENPNRQCSVSVRFWDMGFRVFIWRENVGIEAFPETMDDLNTLIRLLGQD